MGEIENFEDGEISEIDFDAIKDRARADAFLLIDKLRIYPEKFHKHIFQDIKERATNSASIRSRLLKINGPTSDLAYWVAHHDVLSDYVTEYNKLSKRIEPQRASSKTKFEDFFVNSEHGNTAALLMEWFVLEGDKKGAKTGVGENLGAVISACNKLKILAPKFAQSAFVKSIYDRWGVRITNSNIKNRENCKDANAFDTAESRCVRFLSLPASQQQQKK